ncbi:hypothetical protein DFH27DRAFT_373453 [Peziza echinospora]|nr:hypothetical protein DFH27DRAFT_373453 [Peziza echinospora]
MRYHSSLALFGAASSLIGLAVANAAPEAIARPASFAVSNVEFAPRDIFKRAALTPQDVCGNNYVWCSDYSHCCPAGETCTLESSQYICRVGSGTNGDPFYDNPKSKKKGLSVGVIVGIAVAGVVVLAAIGAIIFFVSRKQKKNSQAAAVIGPPATTPAAATSPQYSNQPVQQPMSQHPHHGQPGYAQPQQYAQPPHHPYGQPQQYNQYASHQGYQDIQPAPQYSPNANPAKEPDSSSYYAPRPQSVTPGAGGQYYQPYQGGVSPGAQHTGGYNYPTGAVETTAVPHLPPTPQPHHGQAPYPTSNQAAYEIGSGR